MQWFFVALLAGLGSATSDALVKKYFSALSPYEMGLVRLLYSLPWMAMILFSTSWPGTDRVFWLCIMIALPLEISAFILYMRALKVSPISLSVPFLSFTPVFVILTGWVVLGEKVNFNGFFGIILIVAGSYVLNFSRKVKGWARPFRAAFEEPGSRYMLCVSFIYSITSTVGKLAILHSEPVFFGSLYNMLMIFAMILLWPFSNLKFGRLLTVPSAGIFLGLAVAFTVICHMIAISQIEAAYMISIKRTSLLFGVLYGACWFKEEKISERLTGVAMMLAGIFLIGFFT